MASISVACERDRSHAVSVIRIEASMSYLATLESPSNALVTIE